MVHCGGKPVEISENGVESFVDLDGLRQKEKVRCEVMKLVLSRVSSKLPVPMFVLHICVVDSALGGIRTREHSSRQSQ